MREPPRYLSITARPPLPPHLPGLTALDLRQLSSLSLHPPGLLSPTNLTHSPSITTTTTTTREALIPADTALRNSRLLRRLVRQELSRSTVFVFPPVVDAGPEGGRRTRSASFSEGVKGGGVWAVEELAFPEPRRWREAVEMVGRHDFTGKRWRGMEDEDAVGEEGELEAVEEWSGREEEVLETGFEEVFANVVFLEAEETEMKLVEWFWTHHTRFLDSPSHTHLHRLSTSTLDRLLAMVPRLPDPLQRLRLLLRWWPLPDGRARSATETEWARTRTREMLREGDATTGTGWEVVVGLAAEMAEAFDGVVAASAVVEWVGRVGGAGGACGKMARVGG
ncbi:hypothetical protein HDU96_005600 [Phlyctochytrium bullatum]|nr:hypothetical protein HDU96_005600 [Phlyctochytrium bullatum]